MARNEAGLKKAIDDIRSLREEYWRNVNVPGSSDDLNKSLEFAGRVADYFELAELMAVDALHRAESCGGHFREESQSPEGDAIRDDEHFGYVAAWEYSGQNKSAILHKESLSFVRVEPSKRSYK
jgi:succinate dehydrogenase / fumarate reductase flavoprotein subunit